MVRIRQLKKQELENLVLVLDESAADLGSLYAGFDATDAQIMESIHLELIRIMTLYITGYDAPDLKTGILESGAALASMRYMTGLFFQPANAETIRFDSITEQAIRYTRTADFDHFNRLIFLTGICPPFGRTAAQLYKNIWLAVVYRTCFELLMQRICSGVN